jgi:hypothetical protein
VIRQLERSFRLLRQILIVPIPYILIGWLGSLLLKHVVNNQEPTLQKWGKQ